MIEEFNNYEHYYKDVSSLEVIDIYRILELYEVASPQIQHAVKKLLVAGSRGYKDQEKDIAEAIVSLKRWIVMRREDENLLDKEEDTCDTKQIEDDVPGATQEYKTRQVPLMEVNPEELYTIKPLEAPTGQIFRMKVRYVNHFDNKYANDEYSYCD